MLNFDGVPYSFMPGREVPNKEPPINKFVVEKLYRVHRKRMLKMVPVVDCHVHIPDFLNNQQWKEASERHHREMIAKENEIIYKRIAKAEKIESSLTREAREHTARVENELVLMKRLKKMGRIRDVLKTNRENEELLHRIQHARPAYGRKGIKEWYKHHEAFKKSRRSEPTAGHLGFKGMKGLWPKPLPKLQPEGSPPISPESKTTKTKHSRGSPPPFSLTSDSITSRSLNGSLISDPLSITVGVDDDISIDSKILNKIVEQGALYGSRSPGMLPENHGLYSPLKSIDEGTSDSLAEMSLDSKSSKNKIKRSKKNGKKSKKGKDKGATMLKRGASMPTQARRKPSFISVGSVGYLNASQNHSRASTPGTIVEKSVWNNADDMEVSDKSRRLIEHPDYHTLLCRYMNIPFHEEKVLLQFMVKKNDTETLYIWARRAQDPHLPYGPPKQSALDKVYDLVSVSGTQAFFSESTMISDLSSMRESFLKMFKEVDADGNGYLTFDEFLTLIKQTSIGIENNDLRRILQEADEDGNGVIEYEEFYPLILDLTLAFRTVNAAKVIVQKKDVLVEEETNRRILDINFEEAGEQLSMKVASYDPKKTGVVRHTDLKRALMAMAGPLELTMVEISLILRNLPANSFARINYATIPEALKQAKWTVCKRKIQEYLGGDVFSFLLKQFREKDSKINAESEYNQGLIGADDVLQVLKSHEMFQLNSIQIIILMSDIRKIHGQIDYWDHLSILAKSIQLMLDPSMLRQRAELLRPDLGSMSASALLHDESTDHINKSKLIAFFELNDKDGDRKINLKEFSDILGALELILNQQEVNALFGQIDSKDDGDITFQQFATFFETNLAHLERIKHMKAMYSHLHDKRNITDSVGGEAQQTHQIKELESHLLFIFNNAIEERGKASKVDDYYSENVHKDKLTKHEIHDILKTIDVSLTEFHLNTILGEMFADKDGYVELTEATTVSAHLLQTFLADLNDNMTPEQCSAVATEVIKSCAYEIHKITDFFMRGLSEIIHPVLLNSKDSNKSISGKKTEKQTKEGKEQEIINLIFSPHSGLTANEGNNLLHTFFDNKQRIQRKADGLFDETILHSTHLDAMEEDLQRKAAHSIRRKTSIFQNSKLTKFMRDDPNVDPTDLDKALGQKVERFVVPEPTGHLDLRMPKNQEMMNAITRVKKESVMRSLLQSFDAKEIEYGLLKCFRKALEIQVIQKKMTKNSVYLPVRAIFEILEEYTVLRLNRPQLLALVAFCPYYNRTDTELDFAKFAKYVGETVKELHDADHIHLRAKVVEMLYQEDVALGGQTIAYSKTNITEEEMDAYLIEEFLKAEDNKGEVTLPEFLRIVSNIPKCPLSKRDAIAIAAAFPHTSEGVQWQRFVPWAYLTLSMLDIEHKIRRRLPMLKFEQAAKEGDIHGKRVEVSGANEFASTSRPGTGVSRGQQPNPMDELTTLSKEACELLKVRAHTIENEDGTETERVLLLFPFDEDSIEVIDKGDTNLDDQETVASLDSIGKDQGYGEANIKLFEGMVEIEAHLVEPQLSMSGKSGKSFKSPSSKKMQSSPLSSPAGSPGRLSMRKRIPQATTSNGDKIIDMVQVTMTVNAIEQSMGLDRELAVCVKGVFDYNTLKSDSGVTFTVDLEDNMGMPSMCLIDPDSAKDFAESLHEKLFIEFTKNGIDVPRLKAKPTITYF